jgi:hypothetical protein
MRDQSPFTRHGRRTTAPFPPALTQRTVGDAPRESGPPLPPYSGVVAGSADRSRLAPTALVGLDLPDDTGIAPPSFEGPEFGYTPASEEEQTDQPYGGLADRNERGVGEQPWRSSSADEPWRSAEAGAAHDDAAAADEPWRSAEPPEPWRAAASDAAPDASGTTAMDDERSDGWATPWNAPHLPDPVADEEDAIDTADPHAARREEDDAGDLIRFGGLTGAEQEEETSDASGPTIGAEPTALSDSMHPPSAGFAEDGDVIGEAGAGTDLDQEDTEDATGEEGFVAAAEEANAESPPVHAWQQRVGRWLDDDSEEADDVAARRGTPDAAAPARPPAFAADDGDGGRVEELAHRLESLADELRTEGEMALHGRLTRGGRLDALLAAVLAGYLAGGEDASE